MAKGFDTTDNCGGQAQSIKAAGYDFVARYLSQSTWKRITAGEAVQLKGAGLGIVFVYEDAPTATDYFSYGRGQVDARRAAQQANALNAPPGTTIYFAVDYDATADNVTNAIIPYFQGVVSGMNSFVSAAGNPQYRIGVYGSGATCMALSDAGLAKQGWLACAGAWRGHGSETSWSICQALPTTILGMSADPDVANGDYGAM
jgi:hypothetical protein